jgi:hypothetical protein
MAGKRGGYMPGGGRPKGSLGKKTQELIAKVSAEGISPLEVMLKDMRFYYNMGEEQMQVAFAMPSSEARVELFKGAEGLKAKARECAIHAAPYVHPKLANIQANVNVSNPEDRLAFLK